MPYDLFLSYDSRDREVVRRVHDLLEQGGVSTFFDRANLAHGQAWPPGIERALEDSRGCAIFVARDKLGPVQAFEMWMAFARHAAAEGRSQAFPFIPVLLEGAREDSLGGILALFTWIDLRGRPIDEATVLAPIQAAFHRDPAPEERRATRVSPYRWLGAFREEDHPLFYGRDAFADDLLRRLEAEPLVAVVGPSGSGKSSIVQAGLVPRLRRRPPPEGAWEVLTATPGDPPFLNLATEVAALGAASESLAASAREAEAISNHLREGGSLQVYLNLALKRIPDVGRLLVVIDQFEQLFTLTHDRGLQKRFVESLLEARKDGPFSVVLTLRADFYGHALAASRELSDRLARGLVNLGPMRREELRAAIVEPARRAGVGFEDVGLVERILDDCEGQPGALPLLEFTLSELWEKRQAKGMTHAAYDELNGVVGAVTKRAEDVFLGLSTAAQETAAYALPRLVRAASGAEEGSDTRQIVRLRDLDGAAREVLEAFARKRLIVLGRDRNGDETAEVAHEALIRDWVRLQQWVEKGREFLLWRQRMDVFVQEWERTRRTGDALLRGQPLADAAPWRRTHERALNDAERQFLDASQRAARGTQWWRRAAAAAAIVAAVAAATFFAYRRTDSYQVGRALRAAPVAEALVSSYAREDRFLEAVTAWARAMARMGRVEPTHDLEQLVGQLTNRAQAPPSEVEICMIAAAAEEMASSHPERSEAIIDLVFKAGLSPAGALRCLAQAPLSDEHRARLRALATKFAEDARNEPPPDSDKPPEDPYRRMLERIDAGAALMLSGDTEAAQRIFQTVESDLEKAPAGERDQLRLLLLDTLAAGGAGSDALLAQLPRFGQRYARDDAAVLVVGACARKGDLEKARDVLSGISSLEDQALARVPIAEALIRKGEIEAGLAAVHENYPDTPAEREERKWALPFYARPFAELASVLIAAGHVEQTGSLLAKAEEAALLERGDERRSRALSAVAQACAQAGDLHRARSLADRCPTSIPRLRALAEILLSAHPRPDRSR